ncbi:hypothetical protein Poli38472_014119 [Pythium oligandrum]|uniref:SREBP regulating gene protein n=1 Tax=Pythium oligandrum TaxID=41045 RepID=A0A8K1CQH9_PYTOL|nr:hypothetical protein Poli38472_014119 [Pythium oligandrum]|eukprot:TMW66807.1 hypothetical protein Poli38472_014119 [Pythium oligandrum]
MPHVMALLAILTLTTFSCSVAKHVTAAPGCLEDVLLCSDGQVQFRDPHNNCQFPPCATDADDDEDEVPQCVLEHFTCPDGTLVQRDPFDDCEFYPCHGNTTRPSNSSSLSSSSSSSSSSSDSIDYDEVGHVPPIEAVNDNHSCMKDVLVCPGGFYVYRNRSLACNFNLCPPVVTCPSDIKYCKGNIVLGRNSSNNCNFDLCPPVPLPQYLKNLVQTRSAAVDGTRMTDDDAELAALMRDSQLRREQGAEENDEDVGRSNAASGPQTRWRLFLAAVVFLSHVFVEIGRRGLRLIEANVPRYIGFVDRCLVYLIRVTVHPRKQVSTLRVLLVAGLLISIPYMLVTMYRVQRTIAGNQDTAELTEEHIRPHIIIDRTLEPMPTKRQAMLRNVGDGLLTDDTTDSCENTLQGAKLITDSAGFVCTRSQLDQRRQGCCNESDASLPRIKQFACDQCDTTGPHCCNVYEHCVSCCMHPLNMELRRDYLAHVDAMHPVYRDPGRLTVFQYCKYRCRTSSASVHHQNSYRSRRTYCYGIHRPQRVLPSVNSDIESELAPVDPVEDDKLEYDLFYTNANGR